MCKQQLDKGLVGIKPTFTHGYVHCWGSYIVCRNFSISITMKMK